MFNQIKKYLQHLLSPRQNQRDFYVPAGLESVNSVYDYIGYDNIRDYYHRIAYIRRVIRDILALCYVYGTSGGGLLEAQSKIYMRELLLQGFVVVDKKTKDILKPEYCTFYRIPSVNKLYGLRYRYANFEQFYTISDIAFVVLDSFGEFPGVSPLQGITEELESFSLDRVIMVNSKKAGAHTRLAMLLDSAGMSQVDMTNERSLIKDTLTGVTNAGTPLVAFSQGGKGQIIELKGNFNEESYQKLSDQVLRSIANTFGLPANYVLINSTGALSASMAEISDFIASYTAGELHKMIEMLMSDLGLNSFKFNAYVSKVVMAQTDLEIRSDAVANQGKLLLGDSSSGNIQKTTDSGRPSDATSKTGKV